MLTVVAARIGLYEMAARKLGSVRPVEQVLGIVGVGGVVGLLPQAAALLRTGRQRRIMVEAQLIPRTAELTGKMDQEYFKPPAQRIRPAIGDNGEPELAALRELAGCNCNSD